MFCNTGTCVAVVGGFSIHLFVRPAYAILIRPLCKIKSISFVYIKCLLAFQTTAIFGEDESVEFTQLIYNSLVAQIDVTTHTKLFYAAICLEFMHNVYKFTVVSNRLAA